MKYLTSN